MNAMFLGRCSHSDVLDWMRRSRLLCAPFLPASDGDTDGCPTVLLEAQAAGLPVVAFNSGGTAEVVADGRTGFLVPVADSAALAGSILRLLEDQAIWDQFSLAARREVEDRFDLHRQTARLEEIYASVAETAGAPVAHSRG